MVGVCEKVSGVKIGNGAVRGGGMTERSTVRRKGWRAASWVLSCGKGSRREGGTVCGDAGVWKLRGEGGKLSPCGVGSEELWKGCG